MDIRNWILFFEYGHRLHAVCTQYSVWLFELLSQRLSLLRLADGHQIVY